MRKFATPFLAICLTTLPALAGVDRSIIPADAQWLLQLDLQAALNSQLFSALQEREPDLDFANNSDLAEVRERLGIDPTRDIESLTVYGLSHDPEAVVVMFHTTAAVEQALTRLSALAPRKSIEIDGLDISRWSDPDGGDAVYSYVARHADSDQRIVLVSPDANDLVIGIEALRGESATLADSDSRLALHASAGAILHVSASGRLAQWADFEPANNIARLVRSADVELGESGSSVYLHVRVDTGSSADATRVAQILQGAMALASLASEMEQDVKALLPILQGLEFEADGPLLTIHFEQDTDGLMALIDGTRHGVAVEDFTIAVQPKVKRKKTSSGSKWY